MTSIEILKSAVSPISVSQSNSRGKADNFRSEFKKVFRLQSKNRRLKALICSSRRFRISCKLQERKNQSNGDEPPESLFMKELRRRGMTPTLLEESNRTLYEEEETSFKEEGRTSSRRNAVSTDSGRNLTNQREQSMALNSEGLEGLIPRAKLLLTLGATFFLGFWPLILVTVGFFAGLYLYFGPAFIHDGSKSAITPPQYIDPYQLLEEERISQTAPRLN